MGPYFQYNPREISLAFNKDKKSEHGRVIPAGREAEPSIETTAAVTEDETTATQPEEPAADKPVPAQAPVADS